jgi:hypothetical protein
VPLRTVPVLAVATLCLLAAPAARPSAGTPAPSAHGPAAVPTSSRLPTAEEFDRLARTDPVAMLAASARRCEAEVRGFRAVLTKRERIGGKLFDPETIRVSCREVPFAVRMVWDEGARGDGFLGYKIRGVRYVAGDATPMVVYRPGALIEEKSADPRGGDARASARMGIEESGLSHAVRRTHAAWAECEQRKELTVEYLGVKAHPDLGGRECHVWRRSCRADEIDPFLTSEPRPVVTDKSRRDSFDTVTIWVDRQTWLQVGTEQTRRGELVARYFFRITETNPAFGKDEFSPAALRK